LRTNALATHWSPHQLCIFAAVLAITVLAAPMARAEVKEVRLARQLGLGYLQFYVMQDQKLVEKHGSALGLTELTASYRPLGTPTALTDALLSRQCRYRGHRPPPFLTMWTVRRATEGARHRCLEPATRLSAHP